MLVTLLLGEVGGKGTACGVCRSLRREKKGEDLERPWRIKWQESTTQILEAHRGNSRAPGDGHEFVAGPPMWLGDFLQQCLEV